MSDNVAIASCYSKYIESDRDRMIALRSEEELCYVAKESRLEGEAFK